MGLRALLKYAARLLAILAIFVAAPLALAPSAMADAPTNSAPPPPMPSQIDQFGVDLTSGKLVNGGSDVSIGPSDHHGLSFGRQWSKHAWSIANIPTISGSNPYPVISFGGHSEPFELVGSAYQPVFQDGSTLVFNSGTSTFTFTASDGTVITFANNAYRNWQMDSGLGYGTQVTFADGTVWTYTYNNASATMGPPIPPECYAVPLDPSLWAGCSSLAAQQQTYYVSRLSSITSSTGYQIKLTYANSTLDWNSFGNWWTITKVTALNNAVEYCDPAALSCTFTNTWPEATYSNWANGQIASVTKAATPSARTTTYSYTTSNYQTELSGIQPPGASSSTVAYSYTNDQVTSVSAGGGTWTYAYPSATQTTVTDPASNVRTINYNADLLVTSAIVGGKATTYDYYPASDPNGPEGLLQKVTAPEGNYTVYTYDLRGNKKSATSYPKPGSGTLPASIATSAAYPSTCTNQKTCNKPTSTTDARGKVTTYIYDAGSGGVTKVTLPTDASGVSPESRVTYGSAYAWAKNSSGVPVQSAAITMPTVVSQCRRGAGPSCTTTADQKRATIAYPSSGPSNAQPSSVTVASGDGAISEVTALAYNNLGQVLTVDGPLAGTADTTRIRYDAYGEVQGQVAPNPGVDSLVDMATKYTHDAWGHVDKVLSGTVTDQSDTAWNSFSESMRTATTYDAYGRPIRQKTQTALGAADKTVTDTVYDTSGRVQCTVARMDSTNWSTINTACSPLQTTGTNGPDRVTKYVYDALGRTVQVRTAVGVTGAETADSTSSYTDNGRLQYLIDAKGHKTEYRYDGYDRQVRTVYPSATEPTSYDATTQSSALASAGGVNESDYELMGFDAGGNVTSFRTRHADTLTMTYDNLNRLTYKAVPYRADVPEDQRRPVEYAYDLLGDLVTADFDGTSGGQAVQFTYDALGRKLSETQVMDGFTRTVSSQYRNDNARTQLTHPDGNYIFYSRDNLGRLYYGAINAANGSLFYQPHSSVGWQMSDKRWNYTTASWDLITSYTPDAILRLDTLTQGLPGTTYDAQTSFTYNPAGQIFTTTRNNDAYRYQGMTAVNTPPRSYTTNTLNQYTAITSVPTVTYDANGNLTSAVTSSSSDNYTYDIENRMIGRTAGTFTATMRYDPLGRLYETYGNAAWSGTKRFLYDGSDLIAEYDASGNVLRRYAYDDKGQPQVWFEGAAADVAHARYFYPDERGSIVAVTDAYGGLVGSITSYDEYGVTYSTSMPPFGYTGQKYIPELGTYYYRARMYSPGLGRFMQTDPIGYGDGMNMYQYVHNDPMNGVDPTGLDDCHDGSGAICVPGCPMGRICKGGGGGGAGVSDSGPPPEPYSCLFDTVRASFPDICKNFAPPIPDCNSLNNWCGQLPSNPSVEPTPQKPSLYCRVVSVLGSQGRLRLGGDAAGGAGAFLKTGLGLSLRGDGSVEFDVYFGGGAGGGAFGGGSLSIDNAGGNNHSGWNVSGTSEFTGGVGVPLIGPIGVSGTVSQPFHADGHGGYAADNTQMSGGLGLGPRYGGFAGFSAATVTATYKFGGGC